MKIKKILYLTHPELDYGEAFLFYGLCQILGDDNVVTYPFKKTYYGELADDYILDDGKTGFTEPASWMIPKERNEWNFNDIIKGMDDFDIIILSSGRTYATRAADEIMRRYNGGLPCPLIFTEHEDSDTVRIDLINKYHPMTVFKREVTKNIQMRMPSLAPLPFSCPYYAVPQIDDSQKESDVFFVCGTTHILRTQAMAKLLDARLDRLGYKAHIEIDTGLQHREFTHPIAPLMYWPDYMRCIARSKIGIAIRGWGRDTIRRWEVPAYNTMMLECDCGIITPYPFVDGLTRVEFKGDLSDLIDKIIYYLEHDEEREMIARRGHEHLIRYHTNKERARYFLNIVNHGINRDNE